MCKCNPSIRSIYCDNCKPSKTPKRVKPEPTAFDVKEVTDATLAEHIRVSIRTLERLMNAAQQRGLTVNFSIPLVDNTFKHHASIRRITVEEL